MHEPKLLILDEPTAGVDIELRRSMWGFLKDLNDKGTTIILTTHYLEEAEMLCRNIGIIQHGDTGGKYLDEGAAGEAEIGNLYSRSRAEKSRYRSSMAISIDWPIPRRWKLKCCVSRG
ncbi:ABC transporter ATP-binding protein [Escherichia coli]|uniref:ABC transporter ATP-binding protein n=1 Tax=Escherichia coli TaxID=562 RepID=A0A376LIV2_ECOLX|nr:ABC transporter ATP-binding protein [Escherichia coli]